jgi:hypothetical protein
MVQTVEYLPSKHEGARTKKQIKRKSKGGL